MSEDPMSPAEVLELLRHKLQSIVMDHRLGRSEVCDVLLHSHQDSVCVCVFCLCCNFTMPLNC